METDGPMCDCLHNPGRFKLLLYTIQITHTQTHTQLETTQSQTGSIHLMPDERRQKEQTKLTAGELQTHAHIYTQRGQCWTKLQLLTSCFKGTAPSKIEHFVIYLDLHVKSNIFTSVSEGPCLTHVLFCFFVFLRASNSLRSMFTQTTVEEMVK